MEIRDCNDEAHYWVLRDKWSDDYKVRKIHGWCYTLNEAMPKRKVPVE